MIAKISSQLQKGFLLHKKTIMFLQQQESNNKKKIHSKSDSQLSLATKFHHIAKPGASSISQKSNSIRSILLHYKLIGEIAIFLVLFPLIKAKKEKKTFHHVLHNPFHISNIYTIFSLINFFFFFPIVVHT